MKKFIFLLLLLVFGVSFSFAQTGFSSGVTLGLPVGDAADVTSFNLSLNTQFLYAVSDKFDIGAALSYDLWLAKEIEVGGIKVKPDDANFIPIAAVLKINATEHFMVGGDIGYAVGLGDTDGGFYYVPKLGYTSEYWELYGFYKGISKDNSTLSSVGVGVYYNF